MLLLLPPPPPPLLLLLVYGTTIAHIASLKTCFRFVVVIHNTSIRSVCVQNHGTLRLCDFSFSTIRCCLCYEWVWVPLCQYSFFSRYFYALSVSAYTPNTARTECEWWNVLNSEQTFTTTFLFNKNNDRNSNNGDDSGGSGSGGGGGVVMIAMMTTTMANDGAILNGHLWYNLNALGLFSTTITFYFHTENKNKLRGLFIFPFALIMLFDYVINWMCLNAISHVFHFESNQNPSQKIIILNICVFAVTQRALKLEVGSGGIRHREYTQKILSECVCCTYS